MLNQTPKHLLSNSPSNTPSKTEADPDPVTTNSPSTPPIRSSTRAQATVDGVAPLRGRLLGVLRQFDMSPLDRSTAAERLCAAVVAVGWTPVDSPAVAPPVVEVTIDEQLAALDAQRVDADRRVLIDVVQVLSETYTDAGVLVWLTAKNKHLPSIPDGNWSCSPQQYINAGRVAEVYEVACRIDGGS